MDKRTLNRKEFANKIDRSERTVQYWKSKGYISDYTVEELNRIKEKQYDFFTDGGKIKPLMQDEKEKVKAMIKFQAELYFNNKIKINFEDFFGTISYKLKFLEKSQLYVVQFEIDINEEFMPIISLVYDEVGKIIDEELEWAFLKDEYFKIWTYDEKITALLNSLVDKERGFQESDAVSWNDYSFFLTDSYLKLEFSNINGRKFKPSLYQKTEVFNLFYEYSICSISYRAYKESIKKLKKINQTFNKNNDVRFVVREMEKEHLFIASKYQKNIEEIFMKYNFYLNSLPTIQGIFNKSKLYEETFTTMKEKVEQYEKLELAILHLKSTELKEWIEKNIDDKLKYEFEKEIEENFSYFNINDLVTKDNIDQFSINVRYVFQVADIHNEEFEGPYNFFCFERMNFEEAIKQTSLYEKYKEAIDNNDYNILKIMKID